MRNAKRIAGRIAAWALGKDVFYTDSGTCTKCEAKSVPTWDDVCAGCKPISPTDMPADPRLGGKTSANPALDALVWLIDDLSETHKDIGEPETTLNKILQWRSVGNARSVIKTMEAAGLGDRVPKQPVKVAPDIEHFERLRDQQQWDRDHRRQHGHGDQPL